MSFIVTTTTTTTTLLVADDVGSLELYSNKQPPPLQQPPVARLTQQYSKSSFVVNMVARAVLLHLSLTPLLRYDTCWHTFSAIAVSRVSCNRQHVIHMPLESLYRGGTCNIPYSKVCRSQHLLQSSLWYLTH
jgi:hypothetical protein